MWDVAQWVIALFGMFLYVVIQIGMDFSIEKEDYAYLVEQDMWDNIRFNDPLWGTSYLEYCDDYKYDPDFDLLTDED